MNKDRLHYNLSIVYKNNNINFKTIIKNQFLLYISQLKKDKKL